jgi:Flp pilus assembly protein TadG
MSLELAILFPLVLVLTFGGVQVAFWFQARAMCQAAAQAGVRAGRVLDAPASAGQDAASAYLAATAGDTVNHASITESPTPTTVSVRCTGTALQVMPLPGLPLGVAQSATTDREQFTHR